MNFNVLHNFISPVTGRVLCDEDYILLGDKEGIATPSPMIIDLRLEIKNLKSLFNTPTKTNEGVSTIGIKHLPVLGAALFPEPTDSLKIAIPNPTFSHTSLGDWIMSGPWLPQIYAGKADSTDILTLNPGNPQTVISSSLAMTQINAIQALKRLDNAGFIVKNKTISWIWENVKMGLVPSTMKKLYNLDNEYTFKNAQALDELGEGLLWNDKDGNLNLASLTKDKIWIGNEDNKPVEKLLSQVASPVDAKYILQKPHNDLSSAQGISDLFTLAVLSQNPEYLATGAMLKSTSNGVIELASGGKIPAINDYVRPLDLIEEIKTLQTELQGLITQERALRIEGDTTLEVSIGEEEASRIASDGVLETSIAAVSAELEAQIAALAAVEGVHIIADILAFIGLGATIENYAKYARGQLLNVKNKWYSSDKNDEGHNAVGDFEFRWPTGYSSDDRGYGTLWFDSDGRDTNHSDYKSEAGLRLFSWDSGGDHIGTDDGLAPLHIGLFGYQNKYGVFSNPTPCYKGFIFSCDFKHGDHDADDYRFPTKFGLYDVKKTVDTNYGWDYKNSLFEYDYSAFQFHKDIDLLGSSFIKGVKTPTDNDHVANKKYVDDNAGNNWWTKKTQDWIDFNGKSAWNLAQPINRNDIATKGYVDDNIVAGGTTSDWSKYPAIQNVNLNHQYLAHVKEISITGWENGWKPIRFYERVDSGFEILYTLESNPKQYGNFYLYDHKNLTIAWNYSNSTRVMYLGAPIDMQNNRIANVSDPQLNQDAATKAYVDRKIEYLRSIMRVAAPISNFWDWF